MKVESRKVSDSRVETVHIVRPNHLNAAGRLFGGMLMQWIDEVAALVAKRHTHTNVTTASVDNLSFLKGAYPGDSVVIIGQLVYVGRTSMDIKVDSYVESMDGTRTLHAVHSDLLPFQIPSYFPSAVILPVRFYKKSALYANSITCDNGNFNILIRIFYKL